MTAKKNVRNTVPEIVVFTIRHLQKVPSNVIRLQKHLIDLGPIFRQRPTQRCSKLARTIVEFPLFILIQMELFSIWI